MRPRRKVFTGEERDCSLTQRRRRHPERGDGWGDSFQGGPECSLPVLWAAGEGGTARESKNEPEKKGTVRSRAECLKKNTETCFDKMERIRLPLVKTMPAMHSRE